MSIYKKTVSKIIIVICILAMIPILYIGRYNHPSSDDYNYSEQFTQEAASNGGNIIEVLEAAVKTATFYQVAWQGTYSAAFIDSLQPGIWGTHEEYYFVTTYILCGALLLAVYVFFKALFKSMKIKNDYIFTISFLTFITIVEAMPSPVQGLYWYTGAMTYMFFFSLSLLQAALLLELNNSSKNIIAKGIAGIINAFIVAGGNHVNAFLTILFTAGFLVYEIIRKRKVALMYLLYLVSSITGFLIVMTAPGTKRRADFLPQEHILKTIIVSGIDGIIDFVNGVNLPLCIMLIIVICFIGTNCISDENIKYFKIRYEVIIILCSYALYCASIAVPYKAMGGGGAGRIDDMRWALYVVLTFINVVYIYCCCISYLKEKNQLGFLNTIIKSFKEIIPSKYRKMVIVCSTIIALGIIVFFSYRTSVTYNCIMELLSGEARNFHLEKLNNIGHDIVDPKYMPRMIYFYSNMQGA